MSYGSILLVAILTITGVLLVITLRRMNRTQSGHDKHNSDEEQRLLIKSIGDGQRSIASALFSIQSELAGIRNRITDIESRLKDSK